jgi:hypothetical protein
MRNRTYEHIGLKGLFSEKFPHNKHSCLFGLLSENIKGAYQSGASLGLTRIY